jgi:hypothetical protein
MILPRSPRILPGVTQPCFVHAECNWSPGALNSESFLRSEFPVEQRLHDGK